MKISWNGTRITVFSKSSPVAPVDGQGKELLVCTLHSALNCFFLMKASLPHVLCGFRVVQRPCPISSALFLLPLSFLSLQSTSGFYELYLVDLLQDIFTCLLPLSSVWTQPALVNTVWRSVEESNLCSPTAFRFIMFAWLTDEGHHKKPLCMRGPSTSWERSIFWGYGSQESKEVNI